MKAGYIKLWRKFSDTSFAKHPNCVALSVYLLLECNHEPQKQLINGKPTTVHRGECVTTLKKLSEATGISFRSLRTALHHLTICDFLTSKPTNRNRVISIVKYHDYQAKPTSRPTGYRQATDKLPTNRTPGDSIIIDSAEKNGRMEEGKKNNTEQNPEPCRSSSEQKGGEGEPLKGEQARKPTEEGETAEAYIVRQYKKIIGIPADDYDWDREVSPKCFEYARKITNAFPGDEEYATQWAKLEIIKVKEQMDKKNQSFSLALIAHNALSAKGKWLEEKANQARYTRR